MDDGAILAEAITRMKDPTELLNALLGKLNKEFPLGNIDFNKAGGTIISSLISAASTAPVARDSAATPNRHALTPLGP